jgi:hypothetical protein
MDNSKTWIYDIETYKEAFTFSIVRADLKVKRSLEVSFRKNEIDNVLKCLDYLNENKHHMVGFNNKGFDYPVLHKILEKRDSLPKGGKALAKYIFDIAQKQIDSFKGDGFGNVIKTEDEYVQQIDLYKIHHFDNKARATSLKMLEFNMRLQNIEDLPFGIHSSLNEQALDKILAYNMHDVMATLDFYLKSESSISFREQLTEKYNRDFMNHNDGKIGKDYFQMRLEESGVSLYSYKGGKRTMNQTIRNMIDLKDCLFDYYDFQEPAFLAIKDWFSKQKIKETKGVFSDIEEHLLGEVSKYAEMTIKRQKFKTKPTDKDLMDFKKLHPLGWVEEKELQATENLLDSNGNPVLEYPLDEDGVPDLSKKPKKVKVPKKSYYGCYNVAETLNVVVNGFRFDFGTGGIHGSLTEKDIKANDNWGIKDADVSSMYPNIAISNSVYPEHLGKEFCLIYQDVYEQRKSFPKGSAENAMLKLALNSVYGDSNNQYSVFYDPKYTMQITLNGQLSLCLLAEKLMRIKGVKMIQCNTDGLTVALHKNYVKEYEEVCTQWQKQVKLDLEFADYSRMIIRDVNNYVALYTDGKVKRKGAYQYEGLGWHQNQGGLVIPMAAEAKMLYNTEPKDFLTKHLQDGNVFDFVLRVKVPRDSRLVLVKDEEESEQQRICRYYPSKNGGKLIKIMPPLEGSIEERRLSIEASWCVKTCNDMKDFDGDIDLDYYVQEVEKLLIH